MNESNTASVCVVRANGKYCTEYIFGQGCERSGGMYSILSCSEKEAIATESLANCYSS